MHCIVYCCSCYLYKAVLVNPAGTSWRSSTHKIVNPFLLKWFCLLLLSMLAACNSAMHLGNYLALSLSHFTHVLHFSTDLGIRIFLCSVVILLLGNYPLMLICLTFQLLLFFLSLSFSLSLIRTELLFMFLFHSCCVLVFYGRADLAGFETVRRA